MKLEELFKALKRISESKKWERRLKFRVRKEGKQVLTEKELFLNGIKLRPDACFFENGRWKFFEIEHNGGHKTI